jgi:hypothetical protein
MQAPGTNAAQKVTTMLFYSRIGAAPVGWLKAPSGNTPTQAWRLVSETRPGTAKE